MRVGQAGALTRIPWGPIGLIGLGVIVASLLGALPPAVAAGRRHDAERDSRA